MNLPRVWRILAGVLGALCVLVIAAFLVAAPLGWTDERRLLDALAAVARAHGHGAAGAVVFLLLAGDLALPVPSSVLMTVAGALAGIPGGTLLSFAGAMTSAAVGFAACRRFGRPAFQRLVGGQDLPRMEATLLRYGAWAVLLSRPVPVLAEVISCVAGLSPMRFGTFLVPCIAGTLPVCAVYAWAGASAQEGSTVVLPLLVAFAIPAAGMLWVRRARR